MIKFMRITKELGRLIQWLDRARDTYSDRVTLEQYKVEGPGEGKLSKGCVSTADGFRIHIIQELNEGSEDDGVDKLGFENRLHLKPGTYHFRTRVQAQDHINEIVDEGITYPDIYEVIPSMNPGARPYAIIALDPQFLRDALVNATDDVLIRVYQNQEDMLRGSIACRQAVEVITVDKHSGLNRMAIIMPRYLIEPSAVGKEISAGLGKHWPVKWTGKFPKKAKVLDDGNKNDS